MFLDGILTDRWTIETAQRSEDLNYYTLVDWPGGAELIPASRITGHWVEA